MFRKIVLPIVTTLLLVGCSLHEDMTDCGILRLDLRFTYNSENVDGLQENVKAVNFYIFDDATDVLVKVVEATALDISRGYTEVQGMPTGRYTFIAWGNGSNGSTRSGFTEVHMADNATSDYTESVTVGVTKKEQFYMMIDHDLLPTEILGDVTPKSDGFADLFYASAPSIRVENTESQTVDFDFIRNTNVLKVTISGLEHITTGATTRAADAPLSVYVVGKNGRYQWDNTIDPYARTVRYEPPYTSLDESTMEVDIKTVHLDPSRHIGDEDIMLYVTDPTTGENIIDPLPVVEAILQVKDADGNYLYDKGNTAATQEAIDREYEFPIDIRLDKDLNVTISINDWEIVDLTPNTDRPVK